MEIASHAAWLVIGLVFLYAGAEWLVRGSVELALRIGLSPLVVGLTVVAFGTSAPELLVSLRANLDPHTRADIAVGNVIGSNICNIALLLGIAALIRPLEVSSRVVKRELPILLVVSVVFVAMMWDGRIGRIEGVAMVAGISWYLWSSIRTARANPGDPIEAELPAEVVARARTANRRRLWINIGWIGAGLGALVYGSGCLVDGGVALARLAGVSEAVIGLTLVAIGTSLPELATTIVASLRREPDLITGNIVGSNLFNILVVMGITATLKPVVVEEIQKVDLWVMLGVSFALVPFLCRGFRLNRWEGGALVLGYAVYCVWLFVPRWFS